MGLAYLPDGRRMDYEDYLRTAEWRKVKQNRYAFDNWQCAICHAELGNSFETHHLNYSRLGHEDMEHDIISICHSCHASFHNAWSQVKFWESGNPLTHWKEYNLSETARFCHENLHNDYMFGGEENLCNSDAVCRLIDKYYAEHQLTPDIRISETDVALFFRNRRYDLLIASNKSGELLDDMLDRMFGIKGQKGGNKKRSAARAFFTKHKLPAIKRFYNENSNILLLMTEVSEIEKKED